MIAPAAMDNERLDELLREMTEIVEGEQGFWQVCYHNRTVMVITDETHDRMRIITPVAEASEVDESVAQLLLAANFDRALDARYALTDDVLWAAFIHPLSLLTDDFFRSAMRQVVTLAENYGTSYSSGELKFGQ